MSGLLVELCCFFGVYSGPDPELFHLAEHEHCLWFTFFCALREPPDCIVDIRLDPMAVQQAVGLDATLLTLGHLLRLERNLCYVLHLYSLLLLLLLLLVDRRLVLLDLHAVMTDLIDFLRLLSLLLLPLLRIASRDFRVQLPLLGV